MEIRNAQVDGAALVTEILDDLANELQVEEEKPLSLRQAAEVSGYSQEHLARLVREKGLRTLRPEGSRGRHSFRLRDLPRKPGHGNRGTAEGHDLAKRLFGGREGHHD